MNKDEFMKLLHSNPSWENMTKKGGPGITVIFEDVEFLLFRDDASHYLKAVPQGEMQFAIVKDFNRLLGCCRKELAKELEQWNEIRLNRDDDEGDNHPSIQ